MSKKRTNVEKNRSDSPNSSGSVEEDTDYRSKLRSRTASVDVDIPNPFLPSTRVLRSPTGVNYSENIGNVTQDLVDKINTSFSNLSIIDESQLFSDKTLTTNDQNTIVTEVTPFSIKATILENLTSQVEQSPNIDKNNTTKETQITSDKSLSSFRSSQTPINIGTEDLTFTNFPTKVLTTETISSISSDQNPIHDPFSFFRKRKIENEQKIIESEQKNIETKLISAPKHSFKKTNVSSGKPVVQTYPKLNFSSNHYLDWSLDHSPFRQRYFQKSDMAQLTIVEICDLIRDYNGEVNEFNSYARRIDGLWGYLDTLDADQLEQNQRRFMLILEQRLTGRAAVVLQDVAFDDWPTVRDALRSRLTTNSVERIEAKMISMKQKHNQSLDDYASKMETLLDELNRSYELNADNQVLRRENDRKARRSFENGLADSRLRERALIRSADTLRDSINYVIGQEITLTTDRQQNFDPRTCKICSGQHFTEDCRKIRVPFVPATNIRRSYNNNGGRPYESNQSRDQSFSNNYPIRACYTCGDVSHMANQCPHKTGGQNNAPRPRNPPACYICSDTTHMANVCPQKVTNRIPNSNFAPNNNANVQYRYNQNQQPSNNTYNDGQYNRPGPSNAGRNGNDAYQRPRNLNLIDTRNTRGSSFQMLSPISEELELNEALVNDEKNYMQ